MVSLLTRRGGEILDGKSVTTDGSLALDRKKVIVIEAEQHTQQKLRVAAYARVSTDSNDQANSFLAQMQRYHTLITGNENWDLVDVYADRGLSGVSAAKRPDFQRMLADCRQGRIDKILVKSISRFARNTKECLAFVRELKAIGVGVCFEEQNIDTAKVTGELLTSVFASIAQKESESISQNMRWSYQRRMENGTFLPGSTAYGYKIVEKKTVIDEAKAETVRRIFRDYLAGFGLREIARSLNEEGVPYIDDEPELRWSVRVVAYILSNEKYIGDSLWQKKYKTEGLPGKLLYNRGERKQYYAQGTHEAIIAKDVFEAAQELRKQRAGSYKGETPTENDPLRGKVRCSVCGASFLGEIDQLISEQEKAFERLFTEVKRNQDFMDRSDAFQVINQELAALKSRRARLVERQRTDSAISWRVDEALNLLNAGDGIVDRVGRERDPSTCRYGEGALKKRILITLQGGIQVEQHVVE